MKILDVPSKFQPKYHSSYPPYSNGQFMEEVLNDYFVKNKDKIQSDYVYLPIFWTPFYIMRNYGKDIDDLLEWLGNLDKSKKYFTIVQYASGIITDSFDLDITVFSAGGGGINKKGEYEKNDIFSKGINKKVFIGNTGDYAIPLICKPQLTEIPKPLDLIQYLMRKNKSESKNIFCSFMGRYDTHSCRMEMYDILKNEKKIIMKPPESWKKYYHYLDQSIFALCPRGYGYTSFRLFEAIALECIPIYIWEDEKILPFSDEINWEDFCIIVHTKNINKIPALLDAIGESEKRQMRDKIKKYKKKITFHEIFDYIKKKIVCT
jgi:hypothetical protein